MQINLTKKELLNTTTWSGGTTTQLAIYPKEAIYKNLDFIFRISTATIDIEQSTFTSLPNVSRVIMVLDGELTIQYKNQYTKQLKKFDTDVFLGEWETNSIGKVTDFNVMTRGSTKATAVGFSLAEKSKKELILNCDIMAIYVSFGEVKIEQSSTQNINVRDGDVVLISKEKVNETFTLLTQKASDIALAEIYL
ncbi:MAG TPA: HutD family protein [Bacteroidia bacterium]|jgi:environmental stress-induced protein Ves|nr:HutD family protein [Bacteroidia bacterium]